MQPNTFQGENGGDGHADPTSETPLALATSVQDLFLFSDDDSDAIRVFQGFDSTVEEAAFHQLRGAGALLVSGARSSAATHFVRVERVQSATDDAVVLFPPPDWAGQELVALGNGPAVSKGPKPGSVTFALKEGKRWCSTRRASRPLTSRSGRRRPTARRTGGACTRAAPAATDWLAVACVCVCVLLVN